MCVEFRFVFDQRSGCDTISGTDSRRSARPAFVRDELRALPWQTMRAATKGPTCIICTEAMPGFMRCYTAGIKGEMPSFGKKLGEPDVLATDRLPANTAGLKSQSASRRLCCRRQVAPVRYSADLTSCIRDMNSGSLRAWSDSARRPRSKSW